MCLFRVPDVAGEFSVCRYAPKVSLFPFFLASNSECTDPLFPVQYLADFVNALMLSRQGKTAVVWMCGTKGDLKERVGMHSVLLFFCPSVLFQLETFIGESFVTCLGSQCFLG